MLNFKPEISIEKKVYAGNIWKNRKENLFYSSYIGLAEVNGEIEKIIDVRFYGKKKIYCVVWLSDNSQGLSLSGGGSASGYNYNLETWAFSDALTDAGITFKNVKALNTDIAVQAILEYLGNKVIKVVYANA